MVDYTYYKNTYGGSGAEDTITPLLACAERLVRGCMISDPPDSFLSDFKTAVCVQADFIKKAEDCGGYSSVKLGDFSISSALRGDRFDAELCTEAKAVLESAGLLYRGTEV